MTPREMADIIGCSVQQVRTLIRKGSINAKTKEIPGGFCYDISPKEVEKFRVQPQTGGWPRGVPRGKTKK